MLLDKLISSGFNPDQINILLGNICLFIFIILSVLLILMYRYVTMMFRHYTSFMDTAKK
jgi:hypothetical protein